MKLVVQNLQKKVGLASKLVRTHDPDVLLVQEINLTTEEPTIFDNNSSHFTSKRGYGTAIFGKESNGLCNIRLVESPHAEVGGFIVKKTIIACYRGVQFVSFHGYNGQPFKDVTKLSDHVEAILDVLSDDLSDEKPTLFAGDFNTWTQTHVKTVQEQLASAGFVHAFSWPYPGREVTLDHAFTRGSIKLESASYYANESDHQGAVLQISING